MIGRHTRPMPSGRWRCGLKEARPDTGVDEFVRRQIAPDRTWHEGLGRNTSWMGV